MPSSQPSSQPVHIDQQNAGIAAKVETTADIKSAITGLSYSSQFGIGQSIIVALTIFLSHRREVIRLKRNGNGGTH